MAGTFNIRQIESHPDISPSLENVPAETVNDIRYFGIQIDYRLKSDKRIKKTKFKATGAPGLTKHSKKV